MAMADIGPLPPEQREKVRGELLRTVKAGIFYSRAQGMVPWEIARQLVKGLTPGQMRRSADTFREIGAADVAVLTDGYLLHVRAEREAEAAEAERRKRDRVDTYYVCDTDGAILDIVERVSYATALVYREAEAGRLGVEEESLEVLTAKEYAEEYGEDM